MGKLIDLTGQRFGRLEVLGRDYTKESGHGRRAYWLCRCDCGKEKSIVGYSLRKGLSQSCGCYNKEILSKRNPSNTYNLTNKRFGKLVALKPTEKRSGSNVVWECRCDCGSIHYVSSVHLLKGDVQSCGCMLSKGEEKIAEILTKANIPFEKQKTFENCRFPETNWKVRFDFYVNNKYLIEYDGIQHEKLTGWDRNEDDFQKRQKRDLFKDNWCKENNIPLIRISYRQYDTLQLSDLIWA